MSSTCSCFWFAPPTYPTPPLPLLSAHSHLQHVLVFLRLLKQVLNWMAERKAVGQTPTLKSWSTPARHERRGVFILLRKTTILVSIVSLLGSFTRPYPSRPPQTLTLCVYLYDLVSISYKSYRLAELTEERQHGPFIFVHAKVCLFLFKSAS